MRNDLARPRCVVLASLALVACGDTGSSVTSSLSPAAPAPSPETRSTLAIVAGGGGGDTISAVLVMPLTVELKDAAGRPVVGATVRFLADTSRAARAYPTIGTGVTPPRYIVADTVTDAAGRARNTIRLGEAAGTALVVVSAPAANISVVDTVAVRPGARVAVRLPADTAVTIGGTAQLDAFVVDRAGNPFSDVVTYTAPGRNASVSPIGLVTGLSFGEETITARSGALETTVRLAVVPRATLAVRERAGVVAGVNVPDGLAVVDLNLADFRRIPAGVGAQLCAGCAGPFATPRWTPAATRIVVTAGASETGRDSARVVVTDPAGAARPLAGSLPFSTDPSVSKDGAWVYFVAKTGAAERYTMWRARPDGTGLEALTPLVPGSLGDERWPDPSPDGTLVVYAHKLAIANQFSTGSVLQILDLSTGARRAFNVYASAPRWSPDGERIAYRTTGGGPTPEGELHVIRRDGGGDRLLLGGAADLGFDWSSDGRYLVASGTCGLCLIDVASGAVVRVGAHGRYADPAWRPVP